MTGLYSALAGVGRMERLAAGDSFVHRLHPAVKLLSAAVYIGCVISIPPGNLSFLMPFLMFPLILMPLSGTPLRPVMGRLLIALSFPLLGGLGNVLFTRGIAFYIGGMAVSLGAAAYLSLLLKAALCVFATLLLIATTSFYDICGCLAALHLSKAICMQLLMTYRYLSTLIAETASMYTAYALRAPGQKGIKMKDMGSFAGQLLLRSFDRAERVYQAMKCRGFDGAYMWGVHRPMKRSDWAYAALAVLSALSLRVVDFGALLGNLIT